MIRFTVATLLCVLATITAGTNFTTAQTIPAELHEAQALMSQENYPEAIELLQNLSAEPNPAPDVYRMLASSLILDGQPEEAIQAVKNGIGLYPEDASLYALKLEAKRFTNPAKAVALLDQIITDYEQGYIVSPHITLSELREFRPDVLLTAGASKLERDEFEKAVSFLEEGAGLSPDRAQVQHHLFYAYLQKGAFDALVKSYESLPPEMQQDEMLTSLYTQALIEDEETATLLEIYQARYDEDPQNEQNALFYGQLLMHENRFQEAEMVFYALLQEQPETREVYQTLLEIYRRQLNYEALSLVLERKIEQFPDQKKLWEEFGEVLEIRGMNEVATTLYERAINRFEGSYTFYRRKALMHYYDGKPEQAAELLDEAESKLGSLPEISLDLGMLYFAQGNYDEALEKIENIDMNYAEDQVVNLIAARASQKVGNYPKAARYYKAISSSDSPHPEAWLFLIEQGHISPDELDFLNLFEILIKRFEELEEDASVYAQMAVRGLPANDPYLFYPFSKRAESFVGELEKLKEESIDKLGYERARRLIDELQQLFPENAIAYRFGGTYYRLIDDSELALLELNRAADLNSGDHRTYLEIAEIYENKQSYGDAAVWYERALTAGAGGEVYPLIVRMHRSNETLDDLIRRWKIRYNSGQASSEFRESLIDALHRAGRSEEAREIARGG